MPGFFHHRCPIDNNPGYNSSTSSPHHCFCYHRCLINHCPSHDSSASSRYIQPLPPSPCPLHRRLRFLLLPRMSRHQRHVLRVRSRVILIRLLQPHAVQLQRVPFRLLLPRRRLSAERVPKRDAGRPRLR